MLICIFILQGQQVYRVAVYSEGYGCVIFWDFVLYRGEMNDWEMSLNSVYTSLHFNNYVHMQDATHKLLSTGECTPEDLCFSLQVCT